MYQNTPSGAAACSSAGPCNRLVHCVQGGGIPRQIQPGRPVQPPLERLNPLHIFLLIQDGSPPFLKGLSPVRRGGWGISLAD